MIHNISAVLLKDFYKTDHRRQYPANTTKVYSNLTARISRMPEVNEIVVFGIQYFVEEYLMRAFNETFFNRPKSQVIVDYKRRMDTSLGPDAISTEHLEALHDLGYLPIHLKALPEGSITPLKIPVLTIANTDPRFAWITNFLETLLSNTVWHPITSATIAHEYRKLLTAAAEKSSDMADFVDFQGHDFSMRGHACLTSSIVSGAAHLTSFKGTDTIPAIDFLEYYYGANAEKELIGASVPATEHAVMCLGGKETEKETYRRLITEVYPSGIVSIVSDTWDYFQLLTETLVELKPEIMGRNGKLVIRPDSGDPVKIIVGDHDAPKDSPEYRGTVELLWDTFGGTTNSKGFKQLDSHIGVIYGDSITLERAKAIVSGLIEKGYASTNIVFGIGSYTYQYVTRDTFGFAMKATYGEIDGQKLEIYKDPKTDGGVKKSAKGLLCVTRDFKLEECVSEAREKEGLLQTVFLNGVQYNRTTLAEIRKKLK